MTFGELLKKFNCYDVVELVIAIYPDEIKNANGYENVYNELITLEPSGSEYTIHIEHEYDTWDGIREEFDHVYLTRSNDSTRWAADFVDWAEVLSMQIDSDTITKYSTIEIMAHIMFEISFYGWSNKAVQAKGNHILEIKEGIDSGTIKTIPFDPNMFD